jgi:hypothetical protein
MNRGDEDVNEGGHRKLFWRERLYQMFYDRSIRILAGVRENLSVDSNLLSYWR